MTDKTKGILMCLLSGLFYVAIIAIGVNLGLTWLKPILISLGIIISPSLTRSAIKKYLDEDSFVGWSYTCMAFALGLFIVYIGVV